MTFTTVIGQRGVNDLDLKSVKTKQQIQRPLWKIAVKDNILRL